METKKWLNIIVDGNSALAPYWPKIVSQYLEKIIRTFFDKSKGKGANLVQCNLGLVLYNANSDLGLDVQYINWTRDVNHFLGMLSSLAFNGDNVNQYTMVEGFAEALVMFPRPSNIMTTQEYYNGERHCILIAVGDPFPRRMLVSVPEIQEGFIGTQLLTLKADFYEVAKMFGPLGVSLSIISPIHHPAFEVIFNMGNNDSPSEKTPISNNRMGQFTILVSRNFKEAHDALGEKITMDPPTNSMGLPMEFANDHQASTAREGSSKALVQEGSSKGVVGGNLENCTMSTTVGVGNANPTHASAANNIIFPHSIGNKLNIQPYSLPSTFPHASDINSNNRHPNLPFQMTDFTLPNRPPLGPSIGVPSVLITPPFNPNDFWPPLPSSTNFQDYTQTWEGSLAGKIYSKRTFIYTTKAFKRGISPLSFTNDWSCRLEITHYISLKALNQTIKVCHGPIDYVFFHVLEFNNLILHDHLKNKNLCAKIHLPFQILILSPTTSKYHYIGTVFPRDTIFVEPI